MPLATVTAITPVCLLQDFTAKALDASGNTLGLYALHASTHRALHLSAKTLRLLPRTP